MFRNFTLLLSLVLLRPSLLYSQEVPTLEPDFTVETPDERIQFGISAGVGGDSIVVGDMLLRRAYVYERDTGAYRFELVPDSDNFREFNQFGSDVAVWGDVALVGARIAVNEKDGELVAGAGYLFDTQTGEQLHRLLANHAPGQRSKIGSSVTLNDKYAVLGSNRGYAFVFDVNTGEELYRFVPETLSDITSSGSSDVELHGDFLVHGMAGAATDGVLDPTVFVYDLTTGDEILKLSPGLTRFGVSVEIAQDRIFAHADFRVMSYDFDGNLLNEFRVDSQNGGPRSLSYDDGVLVLGGLVFDPETLDPMYQLSNPGYMSVHAGQVVAGVSRLGQVFSYTIPEPGTGHWGCLIAVVAFHYFRRQRRTASRQLVVCSFVQFGIHNVFRQFAHGRGS